MPTRTRDIPREPPQGGDPDAAPGSAGRFADRPADGFAASTLPAAAGCLLLLALAWFLRFLQDDAFISFRYARNLVDGLGLVWNAGERVEGYTNFLWTILVAGGMTVGLDPGGFTTAVGLGLHAGTLWMTWRLAALVLPGPAAALTALALAGTNYTFAAYATGGLETPLVTAIFVGSCLAAARMLHGRLDRNRGLVALSALVTLGTLTRLDTALLLAGPAGFALLGGRSRPGADATAGARSAGDLARLLLLPAAALGGWMAWKLSYYGELLPRAFYVKAVAAPFPEQGLRYLYTFLVSYWLWPFFFLALFRFGRLFRRERAAELMLASSAALWLLYLLKVGGDFMEFRFLAALVPALMILLTGMLFDWTGKGWLRAAGAALVAAGSLHHATTFSYDLETGVEPVPMLAGHLTLPEENWTGIGKQLAAAFRPEEGVVIATTAAGAIAYHSRLTTVDMLGLNEPPALIERHPGVRVSSIPGHQFVLSLEYLAARGVHLVISHPMVTKIGDRPSAIPLLPMAGPPHLRAEMLGMPIGGGYEVWMIAIRKHPAVEAAAARLGWSRRELVF